MAKKYVEKSKHGLNYSCLCHSEADKREEDDIHRDIISHRLKQDLVRIR